MMKYHFLRACGAARRGGPLTPPPCGAAGAEKLVLDHFSYSPSMRCWPVGSWVVIPDLCFWVCGLGSCCCHSGASAPHSLYGGQDMGIQSWRPRMLTKRKCCGGRGGRGETASVSNTSWIYGHCTPLARSAITRGMPQLYPGTLQYFAPCIWFQSQQITGTRATAIVCSINIHCAPCIQRDNYARCMHPPNQ